MNEEKRGHRIARYGGLSDQGFHESPCPEPLRDSLFTHNQI